MLGTTAFSVTLVVAVGGLALTIWAVLFADTIHPFLDRVGYRIIQVLARVRDRHIHNALRRWNIAPESETTP